MVRRTLTRRSSSLPVTRLALILSALSKLSEMHAAMIVPGEPPDVRLPRGGEFKKFWRVHYQAYPGLTQIWECTANSAEHARSLAYTRGDIDPSNISKIEPLFDE